MRGVRQAIDERSLAIDRAVPPRLPPIQVAPALFGGLQRENVAPVARWGPLFRPDLTPCHGPTGYTGDSRTLGPIVPHDEAILGLSVLVCDSTGLSLALLSGDLAEARFRAGLVVMEANAQRLPAVQAAAETVVQLLGGPGRRPRPGYAAAVLNLADELDRASAFLCP